MTSCRTLLLAAVAALALLLPLGGTTSQTHAAPHRSSVHRHAHRSHGYRHSHRRGYGYRHAHRHGYGWSPHYYVYWRGSPDDWWTCYGKYRYYDTAQWVADSISSYYDVDTTVTSYPICY
jgi:hypothetical protein